MATVAVDTISPIPSLGNSKGHRGKDGGKGKVEARHGMNGVYWSRFSVCEQVDVASDL